MFLENIFQINLMNDVSTFYLDWGFCPTHAFLTFPYSIKDCDSMNIKCEVKIDL